MPDVEMVYAPAEDDQETAPDAYDANTDPILRRELTRTLTMERQLRGLEDRETQERRELFRDVRSPVQRFGMRSSSAMCKPRDIRGGGVSAYFPLLRVDLASESRVIYEDRLWLGHPIYRPYHSDCVAFRHEGPHDLVDARMWLINEDGSNMRKVKTPCPRRELYARILGAGRFSPDVRLLFERPARAQHLPLRSTNRAGRNRDDHASLSAPDEQLRRQPVSG